MNGDPRKWQYLTLYVSYDSKENKWSWRLDDYHQTGYAAALAHLLGSPSAGGGNPVRFLQEVLGPDGWELIALESTKLSHFGSHHNMDAFWLENTYPDATRYWFKRPAS